MKRVKVATQSGVVFVTALMLSSAGAQASATLTSRNAGLYPVNGAITLAPGGNLDLRSSASDPSIIRGPGGTLVVHNPYARLELTSAPPHNSLQPVAGKLAQASSSVSGSMGYSTAGSSGNFSENDSSMDGSMVTVSMNRKGYAYQAEAESQNGKLKTRADTKWVQNSSPAYNSGNSYAKATSVWSDWFVITGGTGVGMASFASLLDGTMTAGKFGSAAYSLNIGYATDCYVGCNEASQNQSLFNQGSTLSGMGKSKLSQEIEGDFSFAYGQAFQLTATLHVNAVNGGMADFTLASLDSNSLILPSGASLLSGPGIYVQAVPEPETYAMMLAGLGLVGFAAIRRRAMSM